MATVIATPNEVAQTFEYKPAAEEPTEQYFARTEAALQKLQDTSDALPPGEIVGGLITFPRGDGCAYYQVVSATPLKLIHIPFCDAWTADPITIRGLRKSDVDSMLHHQRNISAMFKEANKEQNNATS